jgi:hypothetical protein
MTRRFALASIYTLFAVAVWSTAVPVARWLLIIVPVYWAWAAFSLHAKPARLTMLAVSVALLVACFLFIADHDNRAGGPFCLWDDGHCGSRWFN